MEYNFSIASNDSIGIPFPGGKRSYRESNPLIASHETWSTRYRCFQVYICYQMSYLSALKFCQNAGKYGFAIILPYVICTIFIGIPSALVEIMLGRFVMGRVSRAWTMCPPAIGIFWTLFLITMLEIVYGYVCNTYLLKYFFSSLSGRLSWGSCNGTYSEVSCYVLGKKSIAFSNCLKSHTEEFCHELTWVSSGTLFFRNAIQNKNNMNEIIFTVVCLIVSIAIILVIVFRGVRSMEKILNALMYSSITIWIVLVFVTYYSSDALPGITKLWEFDCGVLLNHTIWVLGFEDTIFVLGLARLSLSFISSHGKFTDNILFDVLMVNFGGILSCILFSVPILSVIQNTKNLDNDLNEAPLFNDTISVIISMSEAFMFYPKPTWFWCGLFFLDSFLVSCGSLAVLMLALCECVEEMSGQRGKIPLLVSVMSVIMFVLSSLFLFFQIFNKLDYTTVLGTTIILCTITWQGFYGIRKFNYDYYFMMGHPVPIFIKSTWLTLLVLPFIGIFLKMYYEIPNKPVEYIVYIYIGVPVLIYILNIAIRLRKFKSIFSANPDWGPTNLLLKKSRLVFESSTVTKEFMYRQELYKKPLFKTPVFAKQNIVQVI